MGKHLFSYLCFQMMSTKDTMVGLGYTCPLKSSFQKLGDGVVLCDILNFFACLLCAGIFIILEGRLHLVKQSIGESSFLTDLLL